MKIGVYQFGSTEKIQNNLDIISNAMKLAFLKVLENCIKTR